MTITIQLPWRRSRRRSRRESAERTRQAASAQARRNVGSRSLRAARQRERPGPLTAFLKAALYVLFVSLPLVTLFQTVLARSTEASVSSALNASAAPGVSAASGAEDGSAANGSAENSAVGGPAGNSAFAPFRLRTTIAGPNWAYSVPFGVRNKAVIERLIQCESGGMNISAPDSDGITSDGILQFHRGPSDTLDRGTWNDFSRASGIVGSPRDPAAAIRMTDWAISHGLGPRWSCWQREELGASAPAPLPLAPGAFRRAAPSWPWR